MEKQKWLDGWLMKSALNAPIKLPVKFYLIHEVMRVTNFRYTAPMFDDYTVQTSNYNQDYTQ